MPLYVCQERHRHAEALRKRFSRLSALGYGALDVFLQAHAGAREQIVLDVDATGDPLHGNQEERFFHGYCKNYCCLPLYICCGEFVLCARLQPGNMDASEGAVGEPERIVGQIRKVWPEVKVIVRGDSGFCLDSIMTWCEAHKVIFPLGEERTSQYQPGLYFSSVAPMLMQALRRLGFQGMQTGANRVNNRFDAKAHRASFSCSAPALVVTCFTGTAPIDCLS